MRLRRLVGIVSIVLAGMTGTALAQTPTAEAEFTCEGDKSVHAAFYPERVDLRLSDGRTVELPQTISASGARYANADETLVFWNKGNTAFITEGTGGDETYSNCVTTTQADAAPAAPAPTVEAEFTCDGDKSVHAAFYPEKVDLRLSDGRTVELPQTISASGARYANADETLVFWNKGNTAFITEGTGGEETYSNCVTETR